MSNINERACTDTYTRPLARSCCVVTDHSGMSLRTHFQPDLTIVEAHGAVHAGNAARLSDCVDDLASRDRPLILDLWGVDFFGGDGFRALVRIAEKCQRTGVRWALVTGEAVDRLLGITHSNYRLPIAASVGEALQQLTSTDPARSLAQRITTREFTRC